VIAYVAQAPEHGRYVVLVGTQWMVVHQNGEFVLQSAADRGLPGSFRYAARRGPVGFAFASHVRRGFGFAENEAPYLNWGGKPLWFHFGGSAFQAALQVLDPSLEPVKGLAGLALLGLPSRDRLGVTLETARFRALLIRESDRLASLLTPGPYHSYLPQDIRQEVVVDLLDPSSFKNWIQSRTIRSLDSSDPRDYSLRRALQALM
jgi:hypothetical protein